MDKLKTILVVEDDEEIVGLLKLNLENQGYRVVTAEEGHKALKLARETKPDLILLDIMLPGMDGYEICRNLRASDELQHIPVIMLTARGEELDVVLGLEMGADDYVTKPFSVRELMSRVKAHLRRNGKKQEQVEKEASSAGREEEALTAGQLTLKPGEYKVYIGDKLISLTNKEFELLKLLMLNKGIVLKRDFLLERIWGYDTEIDTRTVDVHIRYLRQKIEENPAEPRYIETVRGVGYSFRSP